LLRHRSLNIRGSFHPPTSRYPPQTGDGDSCCHEISPVLGDGKRSQGGKLCSHMARFCLYSIHVRMLICNCRCAARVVRMARRSPCAAPCCLCAAPSFMFCSTLSVCYSCYSLLYVRCAYWIRELLRELKEHGVRSTSTERRPGSGHVNGARMTMERGRRQCVDDNGRAWMMERERRGHE
jgi:hypothetical protein